MYLALLDENGTIYKTLTNSASSGVTLFGYNTMPEWDTVESSFEKEFSGLIKIIKNFQVMSISLVAGVIGFIGKLAGYFICTSNAVMIIARVVFCPIAIEAGVPE